MLYLTPGSTYSSLSLVKHEVSFAELLWTEVMNAVTAPPVSPSDQLRPPSDTHTSALFVHELYHILKLTSLFFPSQRTACFDLQREYF